MVMVLGNNTIAGFSSITESVEIKSPSYVKFNSTGGGSSSEYWIGRGGINGASLATYAPSGSALEFGIANDCKFYSNSTGQLFHNMSGGPYLFGSSGNCYYTKGAGASGVTSSGWTDTSLVWSGVYVPVGVKKIFMWFHLTIRSNGISQNHTAFRLKVSDGTSTTYIGDNSWGFGISADVGSSMGGANWNTYSQHINLFDFHSGGNQASISATKTYTMTLQATDAYGNGSNLYIAGEGSGTNTSYTPIHGTIWVL